MSHQMALPQYPRVLSHWLGVARGKRGLGESTFMEPEEQQLCSHSRRAEWCVSVATTVHSLCHTDLLLHAGEGAGSPRFPGPRSLKEM